MNITRVIVKHTGMGYYAVEIWENGTCDQVIKADTKAEAEYLKKLAIKARK